MGLRGPAKKPVHLKIVAGTAARDVIPECSPVPQDQALLELPAPPFEMPNQVALNEWRNVGGALVERALLTGERLMTLAIYCATAGKIAQKFSAGDTPPAHLIAQHKSLAKELGIIGQAGPRDDSAKSAPKGRFARLKDRANGVD